MDVSTRWWYGHHTVEQKHMDVSTRWWYGHLTVEPKTQGCLHVGDMDISQWNRKHMDVSTQ